MIVQKLDASAIQGKRIDLGRACECQAMRLEFDISSWKGKYPSCEVQLIVKNPAGVVYRADVDCTGAVIGWTLTEKDTTAPGYGEIELAMYDGNGRKILSAIAKTHMEKSLLLEEPTEAPSPAQPWIDQAKEIAAKAEAAAAKAESAAGEIKSLTASAKTLEPEKPATAIYEDGALRLGIPKGKDGLDAPQIDDSTVSASTPWSSQKIAAHTDGLSYMEPWYEGTNLTAKFADEIAEYPSPWAWIKARIAAGNFTGLHTADYIPFTTTNGYTFYAQIMGINTYKESGAAPDGDASLSKACGKHIDFITRELWPERVQYNLADCNNSPDAKTGVIWTTTNAYYFLNSLAGQVINSAKPYTMANVDYTSGGVYYYLPDELKNAISEKKVYAERRYDNALLTHSNGVWWASLGKLWLPNEVEILGTYVYGAPETTTYCAVYPLFNGFRGRVRLKHDAPRRSSWWQMSAYEGSMTDVLATTHAGGVTWINASYALSVPICFRIA